MSTIGWRLLLELSKVNNVTPSWRICTYSSMSPPMPPSEDHCCQPPRGGCHREVDRKRREKMLNIFIIVCLPRQLLESPSSPPPSPRLLSLLLLLSFAQCVLVSFSRASKGNAKRGQVFFFSGGTKLKRRKLLSPEFSFLRTGDKLCNFN